MIIILFLLISGYARSQSEDSAGVIDAKEIPDWLKQKIIEMSIDEHYAHTKVFRYEKEGNFVFWINNPWSSCLYCELYNYDGTRLSDESLREFLKTKDEPVLIWENYPAVPYDSLKENLNTAKGKKVFI